MAKNESPHFLTPFVAGILAWIVPGAGHVYLGRTVRGVILCVCINGLFWSGVAFGGVFTVEPREQRWWFIAQMFTGTSGAVSWYRQKLAREDVLRQREELLSDERAGAGLSPQQAEERVLTDSRRALVYPAGVVARAYSGIAGMLNLMCIFDAFMLAAMGRLGEPPPPRRPAKPKEQAA